MKTLAVTLSLLAASAAWTARAGDAPGGHMTTALPEYHVADPSAPPVTRANALDSERFWPYQAALVRPFESVAAGSVGVLIRLEADGVARLDFGRDGLHRVPLDATDLIERANAIRLGAAEKSAPNFVFAIGPRLIDSRTPAIHGYPIDDTMQRRFFVCVFADPWRKEFGKLVRDLGPLLERRDLLLVLFPQSHRPDAQVSGQLRAMRWPVSFVYAHLSEPYTRTLLESGAALPAVSLVSSEGRLLYEARFGADTLAGVSAALGPSSASGE